MSSPIKSAERVLSILDFLASRPAPVPSMVIARQCDVPRSSTYHLLNILRARDFVTYYPAERRWGLGSAIVPLASAYVRTKPLVTLARPVLRELAEQFGGPGQVVRARQGRLVRAAVVHAAPQRQLDPAPPTLDGAAAEALLIATSDAPAHLQLADGERVALPEPLREAVRQRRQRGFASRFDSALGRFEVAAPLVAGGGRPLAALVLAVTDGHDPARLGEAGRALAAAASDLGAHFMHR